jgi:adenylate kinase family enzyme
VKAKVYIFGAPGSGKSTLARKLADALNLPLFELDELFHSGEESKQIIDPAERNKLIEKLLAGGQAWVIEGLYRDSWIAKMLARADVVLIVDTPFLKRIARSTQRTFKGIISANSRRASSLSVAIALIRLNQRFEKVHRPEFLEQLNLLNINPVFVQSYDDALAAVKAWAKPNSLTNIPEKINVTITRLSEKYDAFTSKLLHQNEVHGHLTYLLEAKEGKKYVAKFFGGLSDQNSVERELKNRKQLHRILRKVQLKHCVITEIIDYDIRGNWVLAKFEKFRTLYEIYNDDKVEFRRTLLKFHKTVLLPLVRQLPIDTIVPGDYSLDDIGYQKGHFFFYDMEKEKTLLKILADMYAKLIHLYVKKRTDKDFEDETLFTDLILEIREFYAGRIDSTLFNNALKERMHSPGLRSVLADKTTEIFDRFRL